MNRYIHAGLVTGLVLASGITQAADQVQESEVNHPIQFAQKIDIASGTATIAGALGNAPSDTDYYYFQGKEGDVVTFDINGAYPGFDSVLAVFLSDPAFPMLRMNDDAPTLDAGSNSRLDSRIDNFRLPATGSYVVGVSNYPRYFQNGGSTKGTFFRNGSYSLTISGVSPQVQQINIDIKPGSTGLAPINPKSKGKIPVALLSSKDFDALSVDVGSLTFGPTGSENSLSHCGATGEDVNADGRPDLVCHFENQAAGFEKGDLEGIVHGRTKSGAAIEGRGLLKIVPEKRGS